MSHRIDLLCKRLTDEGAKTAAYYRGLPPAQLDQAVYTAGPGWRARDLAAHLASTERNILALIRNILAGGPGVPAAFSVDAFNAEATQAWRGGVLDDHLREFEAARAATVALTAALTDADLDRRGRHPFLGETAIEDMLKLLYRHTMLHERDVRKALETGQALAGDV